MALCSGAIYTTPSSLKAKAAFIVSGGKSIGNKWEMALAMKKGSFGVHQQVLS